MTISKTLNVRPFKDVGIQQNVLSPRGDGIYAEAPGELANLQLYTHHTPLAKAFVTSLNVDGNELLQVKDGQIRTQDPERVREFARRLGSNLSGSDPLNHKSMVEKLRIRAAAKALERLADSGGAVDQPDWLRSRLAYEAA